MNHNLAEENKKDILTTENQLRKFKYVSELILKKKPLSLVNVAILMMTIDNLDISELAPLMSDIEEFLEKLQWPSELKQSNRVTIEILNNLMTDTKHKDEHLRVKQEINKIITKNNSDQQVMKWWRRKKDEDRRRLFYNFLNFARDVALSVIDAPVIDSMFNVLTAWRSNPAPSIMIEEIDEKDSQKSTIIKQSGILHDSH